MSRKTHQEFWEEYADSEHPLKARPPNRSLQPKPAAAPPRAGARAVPAPGGAVRSASNAAARMLATTITGLVVFACSAMAATAGDSPTDVAANADVPPRLISWEKPEYPENLLNDGIYLRATVTVALKLDKTGKIETADVLFAGHPAFVAPTIAALLRAKFAPAVRAGEPAPSIYQHSHTFDVTRGGARIGAQPERIPQKPKWLPPDFDYDLPPELVSFCDPAFPRDLLLGGVRGEAEVRFVIDPTGRVSEAESSRATRPEFGAALVAAIETWRFQGAQRAGRRVTTVLVQRQEFFAAAFHRSEAEQRILRQLRKGGKEFVDRDALSRPLRAIYQVAPQYPRALERQRVSGDALIEFIVDRDGQAMLPQVLSASRPEFGYAAATAVQQWFYEPPQAQGTAVDARITMPFEFTPQSSSTAVAPEVVSEPHTPTSPGKNLRKEELLEANPTSAAASLEKQPKPVHIVNPVYPKELRNQRVRGTVIVRFVVNSDGHVSSAKSVASPDPLLSRAAEEAIRKWRFEPGERGGKKVNCTLQVPVTFALP